LLSSLRGTIGEAEFAEIPVDAETDFSAAFVLLWSKTKRARHGIEESQRSSI